MPRREGIKERAKSTITLKEGSKKVGRAASRDLGPEVDSDVDPFFSFQSMESMLGYQRMELHRMVHAYHETAMKFLARKEETWRKADHLCNDLQAEVSALRNPTEHHGQGATIPKKHEVMSQQLERNRKLLIEKDEAARQMQAENFELREQLAAMQAVGASYSKIISATAGNPTAVPSKDFAETSDVSKNSIVQSGSKTGSVASLLEKLDGMASKPFDRLEAAQTKLDLWAATHHPRPDPVMAGLVDFNTMELPPIPGTLDDMQVVGLSTGLSKTDLALKSAKDGVGKAKEAADEEEEEEEEEDTSQWRYFRPKKKRKKRIRGLNIKDGSQELFDHAYVTADHYRTEGCCQAIARSPWFENVTMGLIAINAIWIGFDSVMNPADILVEAEPPFIVVENIFCFYFLFEIIVRLLAFKSPWHAVKDRWFDFDLILVILMVFETWIMSIVMAASGSSADLLLDPSVLRLFKLIRLTRVARMARLLRALPEVMILLKGVGVASRSVFFTVCLLMSVVYIFAIAMTQLSQGTVLGDRYFSDLFGGMFSLIFHGCFIQGLPDFAQACFEEGVLWGFVLVVFLIICPLTIMNMLVGVLVEVVGIVAAAEQESAVIKDVAENLRSALVVIDKDGDGEIDRLEFSTLIEIPEVLQAFNDADIDVFALVKDPDIIFGGEDKIGFKEFLDQVLKFRGTNRATVKDVVELKKQLLKEIQNMMRQRGRHGWSK